jgi:hypothetical protein
MRFRIKLARFLNIFFLTKPAGLMQNRLRYRANVNQPLLDLMPYPQTLD